MTNDEKDQIIEYLRCAEINCDNVMDMRQPALAGIVKLQIQEALKVLGEK